jgi:hypothetical protein
MQPSKRKDQNKRLSVTLQAYILEAKARLNNIKEFSPYLNESTTLFRYKVLNAGYRNDLVYSENHTKP